MKYCNICEGRFLQRPNRFIAYVELDGQETRVHVKNTGRCRELLTERAKVYLEKSDNPDRSTAYDLVAVEKGDLLINMDSQAPNQAVYEWLLAGGLFSAPTLVRPETVYGGSRFDFYVEAGEEKAFVEVKGVTLEKDGVVSFPDAPSERAVKHVEELVEAGRAGYQVYVLFVVQMKGVKYFLPNERMHPEFARALREAAEQGVRILCYDCQVRPDEMRLDAPVTVYLSEDEARLAGIVEPLLSWFAENKRDLPWRENRDPYRIWVSEIMLQQTRVEAVKPYFKRFMDRLPDLHALAHAPEETLLKLWEGLGYYNRVRNLQKAALQVEADYGGQMPASYEELLKLTGIGSYTAGAIASIAFGLPYPAVDGNVLRVLSRLRMDSRLINDGKVKAQVEEELRAVMPVHAPGEFNQALMEIGATVCVPNGAPLCEICPLARQCLAHQNGVESDYPKKEVKKPRVIEEMTVLVIRDENKVAVHKRPKEGLLAGLYEFPSIPGHRTPEEVISFLEENGIKTLRIRPMEAAKHIFTHKEWHMIGYAVQVDELAPGDRTGSTGDWIYIDPAQTRDNYPIPSAFRTYTKYLKMKLGKELI